MHFRGYILSICLATSYRLSAALHKTNHWIHHNINTTIHCDRMIGWRTSARIESTFEKHMNTQQFTHAILACHNVHQAGKLMVTLAAYGSVSDAYYTKPTSTHVDCDGITLASSFEESVYLLAGLILTRLASSLPISMLAHCFAGLILTRLASSLPISLLAKLSSSVPMIHSQRLASSLLHSNDIDKAGKLIAHISACQTIKLITHDSFAKAGKLIASLDLY